MRRAICAGRAQPLQPEVMCSRGVQLCALIAPRDLTEERHSTFCARGRSSRETIDVEVAVLTDRLAASGAHQAIAVAPRSGPAGAGDDPGDGD